MRLLALFLLAATPGLASGKPETWRLIPVEGGGYEFMREAEIPPVEAVGLATVSDIVPLLTLRPDAKEVDYANGKKLDGIYTVLVGREDGTLGKYEGASDIIIFAAPETMTKAGDVTTLDGAIVFALKIDNKRAVQRFERGTITLTETRKAA